MSRRRAPRLSKSGWRVSLAFALAVIGPAGCAGHTRAVQFGNATLHVPRAWGVVEHAYPDELVLQVTRGGNGGVVLALRFTYDDEVREISASCGCQPERLTVQGTAGFLFKFTSPRSGLVTLGGHLIAGESAGGAAEFIAFRAVDLDEPTLAAVLEMLKGLRVARRGGKRGD